MKFSALIRLTGAYHLIIGRSLLNMINFVEASQIKIFHSVDDCSSKQCMWDSGWNRLDGKGEKKELGTNIHCLFSEFCCVIEKLDFR